MPVSYILDFSMRKLSNKIIVHSILLLLTLTAIEYYAKHIDTFNLNNYVQAYNELFNGRRKDNIIIGASHAAQGINPKYIPPGNFYNFALDGAGPSFILSWYKNLFLKHNQAPKVILYEVDWFMFIPKHLTRRIEHDSRYFPNAVTASLLSDSNIDKTSLLQNKWLVSSSGMILRKVLKLPNTQADESSRYNGFVAFSFNSSMDKIDPSAYVGFDDSKMQVFIELIKLIKEHKSQLILVQAPEYIPGWGSINVINQNLIIENIANKYQIPFLNYNGDRVSEINYNKDLFADPGHLNKEGSTRFSKLLGNNIETLLTKQ